ncbi:MAG: HEAT repeat domain-containing protein [Nitrospirota bacterium]
MKSRKYTILALLFAAWLLLAGSAFADRVDELLVMLHGRDREAQLAAIEALSRIRSTRSEDALFGFINRKGEDWRLKIQAIRLLGEIEDPYVADRLVTIFNDPFLNDTCPALQWNTAQALGNKFNRGTRAVDSLIDALDSDNLLVREAVVQSLGRIGDPKAVPHLIIALDDTRFSIRFSAVKALEQIGDRVAIPFLTKIAEGDADPYIKQEALSALKNFR